MLGSLIERTAIRFRDFEETLAESGVLCVLEVLAVNS